MADAREVSKLYCQVCSHPVEYHVVSCMTPVVRDGETVTGSKPQRVVERCDCARENVSRGLVK